MADKREQILSKLFEVLQTVDGVQSCTRNRDQLPAEKRPAIVLLDSDEAAKPSADGRQRIASSPNLVVMSPEIYLALDSRKPDNELTGEDLNALRAKVLSAVLTNQALTGLCENVFYRGCVNDLAKDRTMDGQMGLVIEFTYYLKPADL